MVLIYCWIGTTPECEPSLEDSVDTSAKFYMENVENINRGWKSDSKGGDFVKASAVFNGTLFDIAGWAIFSLPFSIEETGTYIGTRKGHGIFLNISTRPTNLFVCFNVWKKGISSRSFEEKGKGHKNSKSIKFSPLL